MNTPAVTEAQIEALRIHLTGMGRAALCNAQAANARKIDIAQADGDLVQVANRRQAGLLFQAEFGRRIAQCPPARGGRPAVKAAEDAAARHGLAAGSQVWDNA
jgi:hypothetical protein